MAFSPDQGQTRDSSHLQALPTTKATIARAKIAEIGTATPRSRYAGKKAGAGLGGRKKLIEGNIGDWKLLKKMEIKEREKDEAVAFRAKAKTKRVTGTRSSAGGAGSASRAELGTSVCSTQIFTTF